MTTRSCSAKLLPALLWAALAGIAAWPAAARGQEPAAAQLYRQGIEYYERSDYLPAAEHLFAYRRAAGPGLSPDFLRQVDAALVYAEQQVRLAVDTKRALDSKGKVTKVVVESEGKADRPGAPPASKTVPLTLPPPTGGSKPPLPPAAPKSVAVPSLGVEQPGLGFHRKIELRKLLAPRDAASIGEEPAELKERVRELQESNEALQERVERCEGQR
ncbi:MAG: hypothetical protein HZB55_13215 [Deltaproteobacteria bacterium]|nr:hypothetical protein [Deltaproteobacteria bacterium]